MKQDSEAVQALRGRAEQLLTKSRSEIRNMPAQEAAELVYELQVHQLELQMQNEELARIQAELQMSRQKYADLYEFAPIAYLTLENTGNIIDVNFRAGLWLGRSRTDLQGKNFINFVLPEFQDQYLSHYQKVFSGAGMQTTELSLAGKNERLVQLNSQINIPEDGCCCTTLTDITAVAARAQARGLAPQQENALENFSYSQRP